MTVGQIDFFLCMDRMSQFLLLEKLPNKTFVEGDGLDTRSPHWLVGKEVKDKTNEEME